MSRFLEFLKKHPIVTAILAIALALVSLLLIRPVSIWGQAVLRMLLSGTMVFFLYLISGEKTLEKCGNSTGYVIKVAIGFWILALPLGILGFLNGLSANPVAEKWPLQLLSVFVMMIFVGLFEELTFRAIINDAVMRRFRGRKSVFVISALACSLIFGAVHVLGADLSTPIAWLQAAGKTVSTGIFGLALLFLYWKTRNVWACGIVHGIYDFILSISEGVLAGGALRPQYVIEGKAAVAVCIVYAVDAVINSLILWGIWRKIGKNMDFQEIRENW
jgi:membrane protease YdiL (CAAX protease family)